MISPLLQKIIINVILSWSSIQLNIQKISSTLTWDKIMHSCTKIILFLQLVTLFFNNSESCCCSWCFFMTPCRNTCPPIWSCNMFGCNCINLHDGNCTAYRTSKPHCYISQEKCSAGRRYKRFAPYQVYLSIYIVVNTFVI